MATTAGRASPERRSDGFASSVVKEIPARRLEVTWLNAHWYKCRKTPRSMEVLLTALSGYVVKRDFDPEADLKMFDFS